MSPALNLCLAIALGLFTAGASAFCVRKQDFIWDNSPKLVFVLRTLMPLFFGGEVASEILRQNWLIAAFFVGSISVALAVVLWNKRKQS